uniref:Uncharacterized protein n=1 Tax=Rhizophora mucronata TaxID=61149 RepID=A0A2P2ML88_RHIMU
MMYRDKRTKIMKYSLHSVKLGGKEITN